MTLTDVNVLVYAFRKDSPHHMQSAAWLGAMINSTQAFGMSDLVLSGFLRIVTNPKVFSAPSTIERALSFEAILRDHPNCATIAPGARHWGIFSNLCRSAGAKGNLVPDAYFAALAIESGSEWITTDRGFSRFAGLRWRLPW